MTRTLRSAEDLAAAGLIAPDHLPALRDVAARYAVAITPAVAALIDGAAPSDPIARQFLPSEAELATTPAESADPIGDGAHSAVPGVVHRYPDRVLLKVTHACAVYCRFCFRREMVGPGGENIMSADALDAALAYIAAHREVWEVILTGGDPLMLSARRLRAIMDRLAAIDHVRIVRFHTRIPVVDPDRITPALVASMRRPGKTTYVAIHANHPRELTPAARDACAQLADAGIPLLGQSVLLAGVNDDVATLEALMRGFVEARIKPYYLHHGDFAPGTSHFRTSLAKGQALVKALRGRVSGLAQPTYVLDIPGGHGKVPVGPGYLAGDLDACVQVEDPWGERHAYPPSPTDDGSRPRNPSPTK